MMVLLTWLRSIPILWMLLQYESFAVSPIDESPIRLMFRIIAINRCSSYFTTMLLELTSPAILLNPSLKNTISANKKDSTKHTSSYSIRAFSQPCFPPIEKRCPPNDASSFWGRCDARSSNRSSTLLSHDTAFARRGRAAFAQKIPNKIGRVVLLAVTLKGTVVVLSCRSRVCDVTWHTTLFMTRLNSVTN